MKKKILILPCGVEDYDTPIPSFLEEDYTGELKVFASLEGLNIDYFDNIMLVFFKSEKWNHNHAHIMNRRLEKNSRFNQDVVKLLCIEKTESPVDTVYEATKVIQEWDEELDYTIFIKDCDDKFTFDNMYKTNSVYYYSLNNGGITDVEKKSYIRIDPINTVLNIVEKDVISSNFCVGFYSFDSLKLFNNTVEKMIKNGIDKLYLSHVIYQQILEGINFSAEPVTDYIDWGSDLLWKNYIKKQASERKLKRMWIYGCSHSTWFEPSWTKGEHDGDNEKWSQILANKLEERFGYQIEVCDRACPSHSIHGIWKRFQADYQNNAIGANDIVIFSPSYPLRFKLDWLIDNRSDLRVEQTSTALPMIGTESRPENKIDNVVSDIDVNDEVLFIEWVFLQQTIYNILNTIGCKWYQWQLEELSVLQHWYRNPSPNRDEWGILDSADYPKHTILEENLIKPPKPHLSWRKWIDENHWIEDIDGKLNRDGHKSKEGHSKFAEYLYKTITNDII